MITVEVTSGNHTARVQLPRETATANRVADLIREEFVVPQGADLPAVTYEDDEGDTINLNLGVTVEFEEALRVMEVSQSPLRFKLVEALAPREKLPAIVPDQLEDPLAEYKTEHARLCAVYDKELAEHAHARAAYDREIAEHARARDQYLAEHARARDQFEEYDAHLAVQAVAALEYNQQVAAAATEAPAAAAAEKHPMAAESADVVSQISALLQGHTAGMAKRVDDLEGKLATETRRADSAEKLVDGLASSQETLRTSLSAERLTTAALRREVDSLRADKLALAAERQALAAVVEQQTAEKKGLVDTIAEQREALSTKQLEVQDLQKEAAALREQLEAVYAKIAGLLPDTARPSPFVKAVEKAVQGLEEFAGTVGAVAVATGQEIAEAVSSTHNYVRTPAAGSAAAAAAAAAAAPSPFVQMMDMVSIDHSLNTLEVEIAADAAAAAAADDAPAVSAADRLAFRRIRDMGFSVSQETVSQLLDMHNHDISQVVLELVSA